MYVYYMLEHFVACGNVKVGKGRNRKVSFSLNKGDSLVVNCDLEINAWVMLV